MAEFSDGSEDYFTRTDGTSNISGTQMNFNNPQGSYFFAAHDTNGDGGPNTLTLNINDINVSGFSSLELRIYIAEDDDGSNQDWDGDSYLHISGTVDSNPLQNLIWIEAAAGTNTEPRIDTDFNGSGDGTSITDTFTQFTSSITNDGNLLDIEIEFNDLNDGDEDIAIDNIEIWGIPSCTPPADPTGSITGTTPACNSTSLSFTNPNANYYWQTSASGTSTANPSTSVFTATTSGTYYIRAYNGTDCWSTNSISYTVEVDNGSPTITSQPSNVNRTIPNTATFSVSANSGSNPTYQWQVNSGSGWNNVTSGSGGNTDSYTTAATIEAMHNNQYRCVVTNTCGSTNSNVATLTLTNSSPNNPTAFYNSSCLLDNSATLNWNAPASGPTPDGYVVFAIEGNAIPTGAKTTANAYTADANFSTATIVTPATLGKVVYKGAATTANITGLTEGQNYSFAVFAYRGESLTAWSTGSAGSRIFDVYAQDDVRNLASTHDNNQITLNWNNPLPTACWDDILIVANEGPVVFTPSGDGSAYTANNTYATPNQVVYKGSGNSRSVLGLTNGTEYCFTAFVRRGTSWSDGVSICDIPDVAYCDSFGNSTDTYLTNVTQVQFNTINNASAIADSGYTDFTGISTDVNLGEGYNLSVNVNTDGAYDVFVRVWIDWNHDGDFNDSGEEYDLGSAYDGTNVATTDSPLSVEVPVTAALGPTQMRVSAKYTSTGVYATSCEENYDGEVEDYTINILQPSTAEINIKGSNITIPNGFNSPYGLNNTLFASTDLGNNSAPKTYTIQNIGLANLTLSGAPTVIITGPNAADFAVTSQPASTTLGSYATTDFSIVFTPLADGVRNATVSIINSDSDENPYTFDIQGTGNCTSTLTSSIWPIEGPVNTEVTITSATDLSGASASLNGIPLTVVSNTASELVVSLPTGVSSGNILTTFSTGCSSTNSFTVLDNVIGGCETGSSATVPSDLFFSEITDATANSSTIIEIFNGTGAAVDLTNYEVKIYNNGNSSETNAIGLLGTLANNTTYVLDIGTTSCTYNNITVTPDQNIPGIGGINFNLNAADAILLEKVSGGDLGVKDSFGVYESNSWANGLSFGTKGVNFRRLNTASPLPSGLAFNLADWNIIDWTTCADSDYADIGLYDFSVGVPPEITTQPSNTASCETTATLQIVASEGVVGGLSLNYQWYALAPNQTNWSIISDGALYTGTNSATLNILNTLSLIGYQFYCQVQENSASCHQSSNAVKIDTAYTEWDGTNWSNGIPNASTIAVLNDDFDTSIAVNGEDSFTACTLIIDAGATLNITNAKYIQVYNDINLNGSINVSTEAALVQVEETASFNLGANAEILFAKETTPLQSHYDYTYWSSPLENATIGNGLSEAKPGRKYLFNASQFNDILTEDANTGTFTSGFDDIDDDGNDWENVGDSAIMQPGNGYAAMQTSLGFVSGNRYTYQFIHNTTENSGGFNSGPIAVDLYVDPTARPAATDYKQWNLLGNPYPCAISTDEFFADNNANLEGVVYLWTHRTLPDENNSGNEQVNFSKDDYAMINGIGGVAANNGGAVPKKYIASGQGFFAISKKSAAASTGYINVPLFNNSMRVIDNNDAFFRTSENEDINIRLSLTSDNGAFNQILIGYNDNASKYFDSMYFDAPRNLSTNNPVMFYSIIEDNVDRYAIQGRHTSDLNVDESIPLGIISKIDIATTYTITLNDTQGEFFNENNVYLHDSYLNLYHNLSIQDYHFIIENTNTNEFNDRFEIVFKDQSLSTETFETNTANFTILELDNDQVVFNTNSKLSIQTISIYDLLGRNIYNFSPNMTKATYDLSQLSSAAYLAKISLSNGQTLTKKAIKR